MSESKSGFLEREFAIGCCESVRRFCMGDEVNVLREPSKVEVGLIAKEEEEDVETKRSSKFIGLDMLTLDRLVLGFFVTAGDFPFGPIRGRASFRRRKDPKEDDCKADELNPMISKRLASSETWSNLGAIFPFAFSFFLCGIL